MSKNNWWNEVPTRKDWGLLYTVTFGISIAYSIWATSSLIDYGQIWKNLKLKAMASKVKKPEVPQFTLPDGWNWEDEDEDPDEEAE